MDINFFFSAAIIKNNIYWNSVIDGVLEKFNIGTRKLTTVIPNEGLLTDEMDASAVLASDDENIYGVLNCGKYLYKYCEKTNIMSTSYLGLEENRLDLICGAEVIGDDLFVIPKRQDSIYSINISSGNYKILDLFSTNQYSIEFNNIAEAAGNLKYYVLNNELRKLKIVDLRNISNSPEFKYPESIDYIQDFSIKDESLYYIDFKGNLCQWYYKNGNRINLTTIPREVCGDKNKWHVEVLCTKNTIWLISSLRDIAIQLDDKNYDVIQKYTNDSIFNSQYKEYYYSRNINKLKKGNLCYFSIINTDSMFIVDMETNKGMFINDISINLDDKVRFYCSINRKFFYEGYMLLDDYFYYLDHKDYVIDNIADNHSRVV